MNWTHLVEALVLVSLTRPLRHLASQHNQRRRWPLSLLWLASVIPRNRHLLASRVSKEGLFSGTASGDLVDPPQTLPSTPGHGRRSLETANDQVS